MREIIENIEFDFPENCFVKWTFQPITNNCFTWSGMQWGNLSKNPEVDELKGLIEKIENRSISCSVCHVNRSHSPLHNHHLIGAGVHGVHPTGKRILDNLTITVCSDCHCGNGGFLHTRDDKIKQIQTKYEKEIDENMKKAGEIIHKVNSLALECEIEIVKIKLKEIIEKGKQRRKILKEQEHDNSR